MKNFFELSKEKISQPSAAAEAAVMDEVADRRKPLAPLAVFAVPKCSACGQSEFWKSHHDQDGDAGRCIECDPPASMALVASEYFYDDQSGYRWRVEKTKDGEWCRRETKIF